MIGQPVSECDRPESQISEKTQAIYKLFCDTGLKKTQNKNLKLADEVKNKNILICIYNLCIYIYITNLSTQKN